MIERIQRPVFFIGVPRSGTTILFEAVARHLDIGGPLTYHERWPWLLCTGALLPLVDNRLIRLQGRKKQHGWVLPGNRLLPQHAEAYSFWNYHARKDFARSYLIDCKASQSENLRINKMIKRLLSWECRSRFATKLTGPSRIGYLTSLFQDACFIHIIRDGRAVVHSLLNVAFWSNGGGLEEPWWNPGFPRSYTEIWNSQGRAPEVLAALQWRAIIENTRKESRLLGEGQYLEIRYEDFLDDPHTVLTRICNHVNLADSDRVHNYLSEHPPIRAMNMKYKEDMSSEAIDKMTHAMGSLLAELGYDE